MNDNGRGWLNDPNWDDALASLRDDATERLELPNSVRLSVRSRIETSVGAMALGGSGLDGPGLGEPSLGPASLNGAAAKAPWLGLGGKLFLLGSVVTGGAAFVASVLLTGSSPMPNRPAADLATREPSSHAMSAGTLPEPSHEATRSLPDAPMPELEAKDVLAIPAEPRSSLHEHRGAVRSSRPAAPVQGSTKAESSGDLNYELTLLRLARAALADRPSFARELLRSYDQRFPDGALRKEYELLLRRVEAQTDASHDGSPLPSVN